MSIPASLLDQFERLLGVEFDRMNDQLGGDMGRSISKLNARGMLQSSAAAHEVVRLGSTSLAIRAQTILTILMRCFGAHRLSISPANIAAARSLVEQRIKVEHDFLRARVKESTVFESPFIIADVEKYLLPLDKVADRERSRLLAEIDLSAAAAAAYPQTNADASSSTQQNHFYGPIAMVQTGPGSIGVAHQHIDEGAREAIEQALAKIEAQLAQEPAEYREHAGELVDIIAESRAELVKPKPSLTRLRGLLHGLGGTISFLPKLRACYESLKWAGQFIGVHLP